MRWPWSRRPSPVSALRVATAAAIEEHQRALEEQRDVRRQIQRGASRG